jgi:hypothetical protein
MSDAAIRVHLERLVEMEYVKPAAGRRGLCFEYELLFDGNLEVSAPQMIGLIDIDQLVTTMGTSQGVTAHLAPSTQAVRTPFAATSQGAQSEERSRADSALSDPVPTTAKKARTGKPAGRRRSRNRVATASASSSESSSSLLAADSSGV